MDIQPSQQQSQSISDDQELAKVLAGVNGETADPGLQFEETPVAAAPAADTDEPAKDEVEVPTPPVVEEETLVPPVPPAPAAANESLEEIKKDALEELRPLVDKLNVSPEEKFDTYLLLLRSTDDQSLIGPAHEAARLIADEARKAQALLDIIKEIDYLSNPPAASAA